MKLSRRPLSPWIAASTSRACSSACATCASVASSGSFGVSIAVMAVFIRSRVSASMVRSVLNWAVI